MAMMYIKSRGKHCFPYESNEQETSNDTRLEKISSYNEPMNKNNAIHRILHGKAVSMNGSQKISKHKVWLCFLLVWPLWCQVICVELVHFGYCNMSRNVFHCQLSIDFLLLSEYFLFQYAWQTILDRLFHWKQQTPREETTITKKMLLTLNVVFKRMSLVYCCFDCLAGTQIAYKSTNLIQSNIHVAYAIYTYFSVAVRYYLCATSFECDCDIKLFICTQAHIVYCYLNCHRCNSLCEPSVCIDFRSHQLQKLERAGKKQINSIYCYYHIYLYGWIQFHLLWRVHWALPIEAHTLNWMGINYNCIAS